MTPPLDPVSARLFPSLARYARKVHRRDRLAIVGLALSTYVLGRDVLSAYQGRVATENMSAMVGRVNDLEGKCQKEYPGRLTATKVQVNDWAWAKAKKLREQEE